MGLALAHEFLLIGATGFWLLLFAEMIVILVCLEYERHLLSFVSLLFFGGILYWAGNGPAILELVTSHPLYAALAVLCYVLLGVVTAVGKWWLFAIDVLDRRRDRKAKFIERDLLKLRESLGWELKRAQEFLQRAQPSEVETYRQKIADIERNIATVEAAIKSKSITGDYVQSQWAEIEKEPVRDSLGRAIYIVKPDATKYKQRIIGWIAYWPPVLVWSLINDPLRRLANYSYRMIKDSLTAIADHVWKGEE